MEGTRSFYKKANKEWREARNKKKKQAVLAVLWATLAAWQMQVTAAAVVVFQYQNKSKSRKRRGAKRVHYLSKLT